jgi:hypothetical protein
LLIVAGVILGLSALRLQPRELQEAETD